MRRIIEILVLRDVFEDEKKGWHKRVPIVIICMFGLIAFVFQEYLSHLHVIYLNLILIYWKKGYRLLLNRSKLIYCNLPLIFTSATQADDGAPPTEVWLQTKFTFEIENVIAEVYVRPEDMVHFSFDV